MPGRGEVTTGMRCEAAAVRREASKQRVCVAVGKGEEASGAC